MQIVLIISRRFFGECSEKMSTDFNQAHIPNCSKVVVSAYHRTLRVSLKRFCLWSTLISELSKNRTTLLCVCFFSHLAYPSPSCDSTSDAYLVNHLNKTTAMCQKLRKVLILDVKSSENKRFIDIADMVYGLCLLSRCVLFYTLCTIKRKRI